MNYFLIVFLGWSVIYLVLYISGLKDAHEGLIACINVLVWLSFVVYFSIRAYKERTLKMYIASIAALIATLSYTYIAIELV